MTDKDIPSTDSPKDAPSDNNLRNKMEAFLELCETLRSEAMSNGLDKNQFNALLASILLEEEQEANLRNALHTARVEEFLETCRDLRAKAKAQGITRETLDVELIAALMDNQARFDAMKKKKEGKEQQQNMMQNFLNTIKHPTNPNGERGR